MSSPSPPKSSENMAEFRPVQNDFSVWLEGELTRKNIDRAELARRAGISESMLSLIYKGDRKAGKKTCVNIAKVLDVPESLVMEKAGILTVKTKNSPLVERIAHIVSLLPRSEQEGFLEYVELRKRIVEKGKSNNQ